MKTYLNKVKDFTNFAPLFVTTVLAQDNNTISLTPTEGLAGQLQGFTLNDLLSAFIQLVIIVAAIVFFFVLVIGGVRWIVSGGDKAQTEAARNQITAGLVGLVIVFSAWAILAAIEVFFGIDILGGLSIPTVNSS